MNDRTSDRSTRLVTLECQGRIGRVFPQRPSTSFGSPSLTPLWMLWRDGPSTSLRLDTAEGLGPQYSQHPEREADEATRWVQASRGGSDVDHPGSQRGRSRRGVG